MASRASLSHQSKLVDFAILLSFALLLRAPTFGAWNYDIDDQYYFLVGQRLLQGDVLYVDIWDRKGPLLYLFYAVCALLSSSPSAYQVAATLCAALTAYGITRIARLIAPPRSALMAGLAYCALLLQFGGENGQAPVIYNAMMVAGAYAVIMRSAILRSGQIDIWIILSMFAVGCAIAVKQSAVLEAIWFGTMITSLLWRSKISKSKLFARLAVLCVAGAFPMLLTAMWYSTNGHFAELWSALVTSNLKREYYSAAERLWYLMILAGRLSLPLGFAMIGAVQLAQTPTLDTQAAFARTFIVSWALVAIGAVVVFPAVFLHYALPLLLPLCVLLAPAFARRGIGNAAFISAITTALLLGSLPTTFANYRALHETDSFERYVRHESPHHRIFIWGVPSALYARVNSRPPSPILFAPHFYEQSESTASGLNVVGQLQRILEWRPETVVVQHPVPMLDANDATIIMMKVYLDGCQRVRHFDLADHLGPQIQWVYSGCASRLPSSAEFASTRRTIAS